MKTLVGLVLKVIQGRGTLPDTMTCPACRWDEMKFVSIEMGYSCRNPMCKLHVAASEVA